MDSNKIMLANPNIHINAKLKKDAFLRRIQNVKHLRIQNFHLDLFPSEEREYSLLTDLYHLINNGDFNTRLRNGNGQVFGIQISKAYYNWFRNNELGVIKKQILNWITATYLHNKNNRELIRYRLFPLIFQEIEKIIFNHYRDHFDIYFDNEKDSFDYSEYVDEYTKASLSYIGTSIFPKFLPNPFKTNYRFDHMGIANSPKIVIELGYLTENDWVGIVERDFKKLKELNESMLKGGRLSEKDIKELLRSYETDTLDRAERNDIFFEKWKLTYLNFEKTNNFIYNIVSDDNTSTNIYVIQEGDSNRYKIGRTNEEDPINRVKSMQTGNSQKLKLLGHFRVTSIKTEKVIHDFFSTKRVDREFFELTEVDVLNILDENWRRENQIF